MGVAWLVLVVSEKEGKRQQTISPYKRMETVLVAVVRVNHQQWKVISHVPAARMSGQTQTMCRKKFEGHLQTIAVITN